jgi:hypothetical protein
MKIYKKWPYTFIGTAKPIGKLCTGAQNPSYDTGPRGFYSYGSSINFSLHDSSKIIIYRKRLIVKNVRNLQRKKPVWCYPANRNWTAVKL